MPYPHLEATFLSNIEDTWLENIIMVHHPICLQWNCNRERQAAEKHKLDDTHPCRCVVKIMLHLRGLTFWTSTNTTTLLDFYSSREFTFLPCEVVLDCNVLKGSAPNRFFGGLLEGWRWYGKKNFGIDLRVNRRYSHAGRFITYMCHLQDTSSYRNNHHQTTYVNLGFFITPPSHRSTWVTNVPKNSSLQKEQE